MLDSNWLELLEASDQASSCCSSCASSVSHSSLSASQPPHQTPPAPRLRLRQPQFGAGGARRLRDAPEPESQAQRRGKKRRGGVPTSVSGGRDAVLEKCETHGAGGHGPRRNSGQVPDPSLLHRLLGSGGRRIISRGSARLPRTSFPLGGGDTRSDRTRGRAAAAAAAAVFLPAGAAVHPPGERRRGDGGENPALSRCGANTLCHSILSPHHHHPNPAENGLILADGLSAEGRRAVAPT